MINITDIIDINDTMLGKETKKNKFDVWLIEQYQILGTYWQHQRRWGPCGWSSCVPWVPHRRGRVCDRLDSLLRLARQLVPHVAGTQHAVATPFLFFAIISFVFCEAITMMTRSSSRSSSSSREAAGGFYFADGATTGPNILPG